jgi:hypothetical protein
MEVERERKQGKGRNKQKPKNVDCILLNFKYFPLGETGLIKLTMR